MLVERFGHRADVVAIGQEALEALSRIPYDAILMDCHMSEFDGYEATSAIRVLEGWNRTHANYCNDRQRDEGDREICLKAGMNDDLSKRLRPEDLARGLAQWLLQEVEHQAAGKPLLIYDLPVPDVPVESA